MSDRATADAAPSVERLTAALRELGLRLDGIEAYDTTAKAIRALLTPAVTDSEPAVDALRLLHGRHGCYPVERECAVCRRARALLKEWQP